MFASLMSALGYESVEDPEDMTFEEKASYELRLTKLKSLSQTQRTTLLQDLQASVTALSSSLHTETKEKQNLMASTDESIKTILNDDTCRPYVTNVLKCLDKCASHGLRPVENSSSNNPSFVKFFGLVKWACIRLSSIEAQRIANGSEGSLSQNHADAMSRATTEGTNPQLSRVTRGFTAAVRTANSLPNVSTDEGKARAFMRQVLNTHMLLPIMSSIVNPSTNLDLLHSYYTEFALFRSPSDSQKFLDTIAALDDASEYPFAFLVDDFRLDVDPSANPFDTALPTPTSCYDNNHDNDNRPELINPEDMIDGRMRLTLPSNETSTLAAKLVENRQLKNDYNQSSGGNPLSNVISSSASIAWLEDKALSLMRFLEIGGYPEYRVFGNTLQEVVCNPFLCGMSRFDVALAIPDVLECCIVSLMSSSKNTTSGLFQVHLAPEHVMDLRDAIEDIGGIHSRMQMDPHEEVAIVLQYLWEMPEPLLSSDKMSAWIALGKVQDNIERQRNIVASLLTTLPQSHLAVLERLVTLCASVVSRKSSSVTTTDIGILLAPIILRSCTREFMFTDLDEPSVRRFPIVSHKSIRARLGNNNMFYEDETHEARRAHANIGCHVIAYLISDHEVIFASYRRNITARQNKLREKINQMEGIRTRLAAPVDLDKQPDDERLLRELYSYLLKEEDEESSLSLDQILKSPRWLASGFHTPSPLGAFRGGNRLSLECMVYFCKEYTDKAREMMKRNALAGGSRYPWPVACINVLRMIVSLLMVEKPPAGVNNSSLVLRRVEESEVVKVSLQVSEQVSRTTFWHIFDDELALEKVHAMAFMILDCHWSRSGATQMGFGPVLEETRRQVGWLLEQSPRSVEEMMKKWMEIRESEVSVTTSTTPST